MESRGVLLVKLSAGLASDIKKFIGTILVSEFLQAVRGRPEGKRAQFCVFVDEFQNVATEDFSTIINEARKFGIATTIAHQDATDNLRTIEKYLGRLPPAPIRCFSS